MTGELAAALAAFQAEMPTVRKSHRAEVPTKSGGKYAYTYADLADVTEAAMPLLSKNGLAFTASPTRTERGYELVGRLLHSSGESVEGALPIAGSTPQEMGSSLTYMRRYLLGCLTGLVTDDDDDGGLAQRAAQRKPRPQQTRSDERQTSESPYLNVRGQLALKMFALLREAGVDKDGAHVYMSDVVGRPVGSSKELTDADAERVVAALEADLARPTAHAGDAAERAES